MFEDVIHINTEMQDDKMKLYCGEDINNVEFTRDCEILLFGHKIPDEKRKYICKNCFRSFSKLSIDPEKLYNEFFKISQP